MTNIMALLCLLLLGSANQVWFYFLTYGLWPSRWWPIAVYTITSAILVKLLGVVVESERSR
jgi:hypothetical protein